MLALSTKCPDIGQDGSTGFLEKMMVNAITFVETGDDTSLLQDVQVPYWVLFILPRIVTMLCHSKKLQETIGALGNAADKINEFGNVKEFEKLPSLVADCYLLKCPGFAICH